MTGVRTKIIVDCDPGHDDAVALLFAARHFDLLAVTTIYAATRQWKTQPATRSLSWNSPGSTFRWLLAVPSRWPPQPSTLARCTARRALTGLTLHLRPTLPSR